MVKNKIYVRYDDLTSQMLKGFIHEWRVYAYFSYRGYEFHFQGESEGLELFSRLCQENGVDFLKPTKKKVKKSRGYTGWTYAKWQESQYGVK